jgi:biotin-dependent carboxylase-like uncharacterized protein
VQDLGRFGYAHLGISASGAADALALRAGNLLVGNAENAAALEMTLTGGAFEFPQGAVIAMTGAGCGGVPPWQAAPVRPGGIVHFGPTQGGARAYLCVRGGIDVPRVLGSASTHLLTCVGGFEGRALRAGDVLPIGESAVRKPRTNAVTPPAPADVIRVTRGPQAEWFSSAFYEAPYEVTEEANRMGLRLRGPALEAQGGQMITEGVALGAIQAPPGGQPIILFVEHQTTGGYPKIANVISADFTRLGQLRPRDRVAFELVEMDTARELLRAQEEWLYGLV